MCLISNTDVPKIAQRDIICYKILYKDTFFYRTHVMFKKVFPFLCKLLNIPFKANEKGVIGERHYKNRYSKLLEHYYTVSEGFIHTFKSLEIAFDNIDNSCECIFKCIIPKGTEYFIDIDNKYYASKQIKFIEKI